MKIRSLPIIGLNIIAAAAGACACGCSGAGAGAGGSTIGNVKL